MLQSGDQAPQFELPRLDGTSWRLSSASGEMLRLLVFFETDCPTCRLMFPYLNRLARALKAEPACVIGISQDDEEATREFVRQLSISFPVVIDDMLRVSRLYDPAAVPALFLLDQGGAVLQAEIGFDKGVLNALGAAMAAAQRIEPFEVAGRYDGAPQTKPGCSSRHLEALVKGDLAAPVDVFVTRAARAARVELDEGVDVYEYCRQAGFSDALPIIPPTVERVERLLEASPLPADEVVGLIPPCYGVATVEKIAANAVMAGCPPALMRVLIPLVRAACDEAFNLHGVQATTHFATPLIMINGPIRSELGFACGSNLFSNTARANSTLGRAFQLMLVNLGGARPGEIDMSTLGNPGKFSYCIAENEEENPWEPFHVERGFKPEESTVTLFAAEMPRGVSEHTARKGQQILKALTRVLATVWSYRVCIGQEAIVILAPEHVKTLWRDGFRKQDVRHYLFENTGVPVKAFDADGGEGTQYRGLYQETVIDGEPCYRKFQQPEAIKIVVAGGTAGKFSAVIGGWATGPRGSQMVTYPIDEA